MIFISNNSLGLMTFQSLCWVRSWWEVFVFVLCLMLCKSILLYVQMQEWMTLRQDIKLLPGDYVVYWDLIAKVCSLSTAEKFFEDPSDWMRGALPLFSSSSYEQIVYQSWGSYGDNIMVCFPEMSPAINHTLLLSISKGQLEKVERSNSGIKEKHLSRYCYVQLMVNNLYRAKSYGSCRKKSFLSWRRLKQRPSLVQLGHEEDEEKGSSKK